MAIKLILTDIDGTIMPYGKRQVTQRCRAAFHAAMDAGILVGPASGRFFSWIPNFFGGDEACCQTALATNGMQVYLEGRKVLQKELPPAALRTIMGALQDVPQSGLLVFEGARPLLVQGSRDDLAIAFPSYAKTCEDADALPEAGITKANVFLVGDLERTREVVGALDALTDEVDLDVPQPMFSNVVPAGWNKAPPCAGSASAWGWPPRRPSSLGTPATTCRCLPRRPTRSPWPMPCPRPATPLATTLAPSRTTRFPPPSRRSRAASGRLPTSLPGLPLEVPGGAVCAAGGLLETAVFFAPGVGYRKKDGR